VSDISQEDRVRIAELIVNGETVPRDFKNLIFPPDRSEYELTYAGKEREEDIIADTMAVPLQVIREFGQPEDAGWTNRLIFGDNLQAAKTLLELNRKGQLASADGQPGVRLIYIDPPFASDRDFVGGDEERAYQDRVVGAEFLEFLRKRLIMLRELLSDDGSIFVHLDSKKGHYVKVLMDEVSGERNFRNEIVLHYYNKMHGNVKRFASNHFRGKYTLDGFRGVDVSTGKSALNIRSYCKTGDEFCQATPTAAGAVVHNSYGDPKTVAKIIAFFAEFE
jgi:hypothetical protein